MAGPDAEPDSVSDESTTLARRCADEMYAEDGASRGLGIQVGGVGPGRAIARMRIAPTMVNGHGMAHGGYVFLLADTAFAFACNTYGVTTVARGAEIVFVTPVREGDDLAATAVERVRYGRSGVYDVTVRRVVDTDDADVDAERGEIVAEFRGQSQSLPVTPHPDSDTESRSGTHSESSAEDSAVVHGRREAP